MDVEKLPKPPRENPQPVADLLCVIFGLILAESIEVCPDCEIYASNPTALPPWMD